MSRVLYEAVPVTTAPVAPAPEPRWADVQDVFYWPVIPLLGWGIGVGFNVWDVYSPQPDEKRIEREMRRMSG